jgi:hypothetical protein
MGSKKEKKLECRACAVPKTLLYGDSFHFLPKLIKDKNCNFSIT